METIHALATAPGRAGVAVIRLSGPRARRAAEELAGPLPERGRSLRRLHNASGELLDEALVLTFATGASFTGEEVVELHLHGSMAVIRAISDELDRQPGLRRAEAGEFTRRALENGRLDLAQVEGLADLLDAETEAQRRQAVRLMSGELGELALHWRKNLIRAQALIEATIDFADEDVPVDVSPEVGQLIDDVRAELLRVASGSPMAERLRQGFEVAIVGPPNAGKSTLLNRLARREAAITSEHAGTTRDVIEVRMDLDGLPVTLLDTAGLRVSEDPIEQIGIERARDRAAMADLRLHLVDETGETLIEVRQEDLVLRAKDDLGQFEGISGATGVGVDAAIGKISTILAGMSASAGLASHERHRLALLRAADHLEEASRLLPQALEAPDRLAEELRLASRAIGSLVGEVDVEDILDVVFASFCIGK